MKRVVIAASRILAITALALVATSASADLLVYEGFDYSAGANLNSLSGGTGFASSSAWNASATSTNSTGFVQVQPYNAASGVYLNDGATINPFTGVYANLPRTGNYVGMNDGGAGSASLAAGVADHLFLNRKLDSSVTSTFQNGTKTYFSFASARGYNANPRAPSLGIGSGVFASGAGGRGDDVVAGAGNTNKEVIAVGGLTTSTTVAGSSSAGPVGTLNAGAVTSFSQTAFYRGQYYNTSGSRTGWSRAVGTVGNGISGQDLVGTAVTSSQGAGPAAGNNGYWSGGGITYSPGTNPTGQPNTSSTNGFALYDYTGSLLSNNTAYGNNQALVNITVGEIAWGAGTGGTDLVSFFVFHDKDALNEATYNAGKMTWDTAADTSSRRGEFNYISMGGGRYFADEFRVATTFNEALGLVPVPEPSTYVLLGVAGLGSLIAARCRRR